MTLVTPTTTAAPAGWYRDPLGLPQLRWWNGMTWTNTIQETRPEVHVGESAFASASEPLVGTFVA
ncbi:DUF2510 domain-containing protein [Schumannella soli]|uniref:DUF2510 domain-containing protein n=1 Tax=Schumannella soli TaxID=2590779 RepID=A0A506Y0T8_9MICO|nr:DUF2510 domain-containing protein [Schumannella soli]TPW74568.1 DUF2510 domain-containing protein [Schumannella soli]